MRTLTFLFTMTGKNVVVLDVRTPEEFSGGHIPGAKNIDVLQEEQFRKQVLALPKDKTYLVYCRSGKRSFTALQLMKENGFADVKHLKTGISGWDGPVEQ
jgi:rhodanese-related sulfurtransferase